MKTSAAGKMNSSTARTLKLLSNTLLELLEKEPLEKISTMKICKTAEVPRATFYNHFEDKYDLLRYSLHLIAADMALKDREKMDEQTYLLRQLNRILDFAQDHYDFLKKVSSANYNSILFAEIKDFLYEGLLEKLRERKEKGTRYRVNEKIMAEFYSNAIVYSAKTLMESGTDIPREELTESIMRLIALEN